MGVSDSVVLAWKISSAEARMGNAPEIEPAHVLVGLCKLSDLDSEAIPDGSAEMAADAADLRTAVRTARAAHRRGP